MRRKVNANGRNIFVYRKGHENKHLGRTFVKYWKEGKVNLPANASHSLRVDSSGNVRVYANTVRDRRKLPYKKLGLRRDIHRKNYLEIKTSLAEQMPELLQNQSILQHVTITNKEYATKYKLRKDKIQIHPGINHVLTSTGDNQTALQSITNFLKVVLRRIKIKHGLNNEDRIQLFMETHKKPIKTNAMKIGDLILNIETEFLNRVEGVLQSQDELTFDGNTVIEVLMIEMPHGSRRLYALSKEEWNLKKCLVVVQNEDSLCAARAISICLSNIRDGPTSSKYKNMKNCQRREQEKAARLLHLQAGVPIKEHGVGLDDMEKFAFTARCEINIVSWENNNEIIRTCNKGCTDKIYLHKHGNHYNAITKIHAFYNKQHYCHTCKIGYDKDQDHRCAYTCRLCLRDCGNDSSEEQVKCDQCYRTFKSQKCFDNHLQTVCKKWFECKKCMKLVDRDGNKITPENHVCYTRKCTSCREWVDMNTHQCYLQKVELPSPSDQYIFFDIEAMQETGVHKANLVVAQYLHGNQETFTNIDDFCHWLIHKRHKNHTVIAHYGKGYDFQFILNYCIQSNIKHKAIYDGSKIMYLEVLHGLHLRFIDSFNFMAMPLKDMPSTFELTELKKGYFPHLFNTQDHARYRGDMPPIKDYHMEAMSVVDQEKFLSWYKLQKDQYQTKVKFWEVLHQIDYKLPKPVEYDHQKEILAYCTSDVDILRRACLSFRKLFMDIAQCDPFQKITIASVCMDIYRADHMPESSIAVVKENHNNFSRSSIEWLEYVSKTEGIDLRHACNGGEYQVGGKYCVDGYHDSSKTVYQFHGCHWHGCPKCFQPETEHPEKGKTMLQLHEETKQVTSKIKNLGYKVIEIWEHEWNQMKKHNKDVKVCIAEVDTESITPLNPRDAFFGGRTDARKLYYKFDHGEKGKYVDICSLYPTVNFFDEYPLGHPTQIKKDFKDLKAKPYFGFIKCKVVPPKGLYHPVLPRKRDGKLVFDLEPQVGTWCTPEIYKAIEMGYKVEKIYEVLHFKETTRDLFKSYVGKFLKIKAESSKDLSDDEKVAYKEMYEKIGVYLDSENIKKNSGMKAVAKLCLNSLWGKFGQRNNKTQVDVVYSVKELWDLLLNDQLTDFNISVIDEDRLMVAHRVKEECLSNSKNTNVYVAAFTTSHARLRLYKELELLGEQVLYHDTDSIVYVSRPGGYEVPTGNMLGEWEDELHGEHMVNVWTSGGPKCYAYQLSDGSTTCKVKGFNLKRSDTAKLIHYNSMKGLVQDRYHQNVETKIRTTQTMIKRVKTHALLKTEEQSKELRVQYTKGNVVVHRNNMVETLPFGY